MKSIPFLLIITLTTTITVTNALHDETLIEQASVTMKSSSNDSEIFEAILLLMSNNSRRIDNLETRVRELSQALGGNLTSLEGHVIENEERMREIGDKVERQQMTLEELTEETQKHTNVSEKLAQMREMIEEIERRVSRHPLNASTSEKLTHTINEIESELREMRKRERRTNDLSEKVRELEERDAKLEHEHKVIVRAEAGILIVSTLAILLLVCVLVRKPNAEMENPLEMTRFRTPHSPVHSLPATTKEKKEEEVFTIYDSGIGGASNPFHSEVCVDGTNMYEEIDLERHEAVISPASTSDDHPQHFRVNKSTEKILSEEICEELPENGGKSETIYDNAIEEGEERRSNNPFVVYTEVET